MATLIKISLFCVLLVLSGANGRAAEVGLPGERDRCPVCGMFVAPYPEWIATITLADGTQLFFDGCKDMFRYYFKQADKEGGSGSMTGIYVTDYYSTRLVPAADAFFVVGSDVYGPMGKELVPVVGREAAETFLRDHGGTAIYAFDDVSPERLPAD